MKVEKPSLLVQISSI